MIHTQHWKNIHYIHYNCNTMYMTLTIHEVCQTTEQTRPSFYLQNWSASTYPFYPYLLALRDSVVTQTLASSWSSKILSVCFKKNLCKTHIYGKLWHGRIPFWRFSTLHISPSDVWGHDPDNQPITKPEMPVEKSSKVFEGRPLRHTYHLSNSTNVNKMGWRGRGPGDVIFKCYKSSPSLINEWLNWK